MGAVTRMGAEKIIAEHTNSKINELLNSGPLDDD